MNLNCNIFAPLKQQGLVALDIGSRQIKVVVGRKKGNMLVLEAVHTLDTPNHALYDGKVADTEALAQVLVPFLKEKNLENRDAVFAMESTMVVTREVTLPLTKEAEMLSMLDYEIQQVMPVSPDHYRIQSKLLDTLEVEGTKLAKFQVVALPLDLIEGYRQLSTAISMKPLALDIHSNCVSKVLNQTTLVNHQIPMKEETVAVLDFGHCYSNLMIFQYGILQFNRLIPFGGKEINDSIKYQSEGEGVYPHLEQWMKEIDRLFKYYTSRENGNKIHRILLFGGSAYLPGICEYLSQYFQLPAELILDISGIQRDGMEDDLKLPTYLNAIGALKRIRSH